MTTAPKTETKPKVAKAPKAAAQEAPKAKPEAKKQTAAGSVKLTQVVGTIARKWDQQATLKGLGLGKRHKTSVLKETPEVRGMINKVQHLVKVEQI